MTAQKLFLSLLSSLFIGGIFLLFPQGVQAAALQLSPPGGTLDVDETMDVKINLSLSSGESVSGVDAELTFDNDKLQVTTIEESSLFNTYPISTYSNDNGTIQVSGITETGSSLSDGGTLATLTFKGKSSGTAAVTFDFTSGSTTDSNVAEADTDTDLLESVVNGSYTVSGDGGVGGGTTSTDEETGLPTTGNQETTLALFLGGLLVLGIGSAWRFTRV